MKCADCFFCYKTEADDFACCHYEGDVATCEFEDDTPEKKYLVTYDGVIFDGDVDGLNSRWYDRFEDAIYIVNLFGDSNNVELYDTEYGMTLRNGEWE